MLFVYRSGMYSCGHRFFFLMIRRPPRSTLDRSSAASDVYKRQGHGFRNEENRFDFYGAMEQFFFKYLGGRAAELKLSLIHISEPTRPY